MSRSATVSQVVNNCLFRHGHRFSIIAVLLTLQNHTIQYHTKNNTGNELQN